MKENNDLIKTIIFFVIYILTIPFYQEQQYM